MLFWSELALFMIMRWVDGVSNGAVVTFWSELALFMTMRWVDGVSNELPRALLMCGREVAFRI